MNQVPGNRKRPLAFVGAAGLVLVGVLLIAGFMATANRTGRNQERTETRGEREHGEGAHGDEDMIRFDPASLRSAGLEMEPARMRPVSFRLAVTGGVEPNLGVVVLVTPRVAGKITSVRANMGSSVGAGQTLATLASSELAAAQAAFRQASSRVRVAGVNLERQKKLAGLGEFGRHKLEEARAAAVTTQGEVDRLRSELSAAKSAVVEARSDLAARHGEVASEEAEVASGDSEVAEAEGQVRSARAALSQAQTRARVAESRFNRTTVLLKEGLASRQQSEQDQAEAESAQADIDAARATIAQADAKVATARAHQQAAREKVRAAKGRVAESTAKIETAQSYQAQVQASLDAAGRRVEIAAQWLAREEEVYRGGFFTSKEIVEAEAALRQAELEREAAANGIRLIGGSPGGGDTLRVTAPIAGRVTERTVSLGETVTPERSLFQIINLESVWVQLSVYQKDLPAVRVGQRVTVTSDTAPGRTFSGAVSYIGDVVDETTRAVKVRAVIRNAGNTLKPQTFVRGTIRTELRTQAIAVPREAVQTLDGKAVVFVQGDHPGEFAARAVQTGDTVGGETIVTSGLETGDRVVTRGAFMVKAQAMKSELGHEH